MPNTSQNTLASASAFLNFARQYHDAAEELVHSESRVTDVRYFLYFQATELLLKAYLRARDREPWGHEISQLYKECRELGLKLTSDDRFGLQSIVSLLETGNEDMAFRYFSLKSGSRPDLIWTGEIVGQLRDTVGAFVESKATSSGRGVPVKLTMTLGKPTSNGAYAGD